MRLGLNGVSIPIERIDEWINEVKPKRVLIQAPLGFKHLLPIIHERVESRGVEALISSGACWGGCDVALREAEEVSADGIIHVGHAPFIKINSIPVLYIEARYTDPAPLLSLVDEVARALDGYSSIGLGLTVQWLDHLDLLVEELRRRGFNVEVGDPSGHLAHRGQVLGCDYGTLKSIEKGVDCFLVVGSIFHALGIALISRKATFAADPHTQRVTPLEGLVKRIYAQRYANIARFKESKRVGIIVSIKPGQMLMGLAKRLQGLLRGSGYEAEIIITDEVSEGSLNDNSYDAYVNTACPRLSIEDQTRFSKPLLLPNEVLVALGMLEWERLIDMGLLLDMSIRIK